MRRGLPVLRPAAFAFPLISKLLVNMSQNLLLRSSTSFILRISLANSAVMKSNQLVRSVSFFTLVTLNRIWHVEGVNCTEMTTKQRFTHMLGVTERGQCACPKRLITTKVTPEPPKDPTTVNIEELNAMIADGNIQLFDVREPYELQESGKIEQAVNIPLKQVAEAFALPPKEFRARYKAKKPKRKDENIVFHCKAGIRSKLALNAVYRLGYRRSRHYPGGFDEWDTCLKRGGQ